MESRIAMDRLWTSQRPQKSQLEPFGIALLRYLEYANPSRQRGRGVPLLVVPEGRWLSESTFGLLL